MRKRRFKIDGWALATLITIALLLFPNIEIITAFFKPTNENWNHIKTYLLKAYIKESIILVFFVVVITLILGFLSAYFIVFYEFRFRNFYKWALVLPLAIPPYVGAYIYAGLFSYTGFVQAVMRNKFDINMSYFNIMSMKGAIFILSIFMFPYVYLIAKSFFEKQSSYIFESALMLGKSQFEIFINILLPLSRMVLVSGATLIALEVLSDYGVVSYFGVQTFTTAIFKTWFSLGDVESSVRIASMLMLGVIFLVLLEGFFGSRKKYGYSNTKFRPIYRKRLNGIMFIIVQCFFLLIFFVSFLIPVIQIIYYSFLTYDKVLNSNFIQIIKNTLFISISSSLVIIVLSIVIGNYCRIREGIMSKVVSKLTILGYTVPSTVIAIGIILFFVNIDRNLKWLYLSINPNSKTLVLSTSIFMLFFAYVIRFLGVGYQAINASYEKIGKKFFEASRLLGKNTITTLLKVELPMLRPAIISSFVLVFIDVIKELPLTLLLRPFNFNTLATRIFDYAADEMLQEASIPSLIIILISVVSISFIQKFEGEK